MNPYDPLTMATTIEEAIRQAKKDPDNPERMIMLGGSILAAFLNIAISLDRIANHLERQHD